MAGSAHDPTAQSSPSAQVSQPAASGQTAPHVTEWTVPGYTELKTLGSGGFGSVVLARHDATGTPVAIKYLLPKLREDADFAVMFRAEAEALGALDDPYVVRL